jgi:hypothetical protein
MYEVEWHGGHWEHMFANTIVENLFAQFDDEGNHHVLLQDIVAHCFTNDALAEEEAFVTVGNHLHHHRRRTKGWEVCIEWKDGYTSRHCSSPKVKVLDLCS